VHFSFKNALSSLLILSLSVFPYAFNFSLFYPERSLFFPGGAWLEGVAEGGGEDVVADILGEGCVPGTEQIHVLVEFLIFTRGCMAKRCSRG
jgi:hypothetical protein